MTVRIDEDKDEHGNVIASSVEISMPPGYKDIRQYKKEWYKPIKCDHCGKDMCMWDKDEYFGDHICFACWNKKPDEWEEEH